MEVLAIGIAHKCDRRQQARTRLRHGFLGGFPAGAHRGERRIAGDGVAVDLQQILGHRGLQRAAEHGAKRDRKRAFEHPSGPVDQARRTEKEQRAQREARAPPA